MPRWRKEKFAVMSVALVDRVLRCCEYCGVIKSNYAAMSVEVAERIIRSYEC